MTFLCHVLYFVTFLSRKTFSYLFNFLSHLSKLCLWEHIKCECHYTKKEFFVRDVRYLKKLWSKYKQFQFQVLRRSKTIPTGGANVCKFDTKIVKQKCNFYFNVKVKWYILLQIFLRKKMKPKHTEKSQTKETFFKYNDFKA